MIVALRTARGQREPRRAERHHAIDGLIHAKFLQIRAALAIAQRVAQEAGAHPL